MDQSKFKYKAEFNFSVCATTDLKNGISISEASINNLKPLIPKSVDLDKNVDLIGVAFNAAVVNEFNKNGDGINSDSAKEIVKYFVYKPTNIEHKKEKVVGHIVNAGFTYGDNNQVITPVEASSKTDSYYISLAAVVYKTVNPEFAEALLQLSEQETNNEISASWELGFNDYYLAVGSNKLSECKIITDEDEIEELKVHLKAFGGSGKLENGDPINRLITGPIYPLGIGFTSNPAANVKGIYINGTSTFKVKNEEDLVEDENNEAFSAKNNIKISQNSENNVKLNNKIDIMDIQEIKSEFEKILDSKLSEKAEFSQEAVANISTFVADKIREKDVEFQKERELLEQQKIQAAEDAEKAKASISELETNLKIAQEKIANLEASIAAEQAEELFNNRMEAVDKAFDLSDSDRVIIAKEVKSLDSSEDSFKAYEEKLNSLLYHKSKAFKVEQEKELSLRVEQEVEKRIASLQETSEKDASASDENNELPEQSKSTASESDLEEVLEKVEASEESPSNNNGASSQQDDLISRFTKTFKKDDIKIKY